MPNAEVLRTLVEELTRVGVDADNMVGGLSARADEAIRALRTLPDGAGPAAFLARLRQTTDAASRTDVAVNVEPPARADAATRVVEDLSRDAERRATPMDRTA